MTFSSALELRSPIGSGFFGDVNEGWDPVHGKVAVKTLRPYDGELPKEWIARRTGLQAEASKLKAAEHDNVVRVHSLVGESLNDDHLHMVMEFCEGGSLMKEFERGCMSLTKVCKVTNDVCRGLHYIHGLSMVHRDIKPANILVSNGRFKVADFGLVSSNLVGKYHSKAGYEDHMAPEVHKHALTSVQTDIWAVGMTLYRLMHGLAFYRHHFTRGDVASSVVKGKFAARLIWLAHIPEDIRKFIRKAMHDRPEQRFRTASEMSQKMRELPPVPDWNCIFTPDQTTWTRDKGGRQIVVTHERSSRGHEWTAMSIGGERNRRLGGSEQPLSEELAMRQLTAFLTAY